MFRCNSQEALLPWAPRSGNSERLLLACGDFVACANALREEHVVEPLQSQNEKGDQLIVKAIGNNVGMSEVTASSFPWISERFEGELAFLNVATPQPMFSADDGAQPPLVIIRPKAEPAQRIPPFIPPLLHDDDSAPSDFGQGDDSLTRGKKKREFKLVSTTNGYTENMRDERTMQGLSNLNKLFHRYLAVYARVTASAETTFNGLTEFVFAILLELKAEEHSVTLEQIYAYAKLIWHRLPSEHLERFESKDYKGNLRSTLYSCQLFVRAGETTSDLKKRWLLRGRLGAAKRKELMPQEQSLTQEGSDNESL